MCILFTMTYFNNSSGNCTTDASNEVQIKFDLDPEKCATLISLLALTLGTICGNIMVIISVSCYRWMRSFTNCLLISLAASDLLVGMIILPPAMAYLLLGAWPFSQTFCRIWAALDVLLCTASILNLTAISIDRYCAIAWPFVYLRHRNIRFGLTVVSGVWILAALVSAPQLFSNASWTDEEPPTQTELFSTKSRRGMSTCGYAPGLAYRIFSATASFFLPSAVMIFVYWRIYMVTTSREQTLNINRTRSMQVRIHQGKYKKPSSKKIRQLSKKIVRKATSAGSYAKHHKANKCDEYTNSAVDNHGDQVTSDLLGNTFNDITIGASCSTRDEITPNNISGGTIEENSRMMDTDKPQTRKLSRGPFLSLFGLHKKHRAVNKANKIKSKTRMNLLQHDRRKIQNNPYREYPGIVISKLERSYDMIEPETVYPIAPMNYLDKLTPLLNREVLLHKPPIPRTSVIYEESESDYISRNSPVSSTNDLSLAHRFICNETNGHVNCEDASDMLEDVNVISVDNFPTIHIATNTLKSSNNSDCNKNCTKTNNNLANNGLKKRKILDIGWFEQTVELLEKDSSQGEKDMADKSLTPSLSVTDNNTATEFSHIEVSKRVENTLNINPWVRSFSDDIICSSRSKEVNFAHRRPSGNCMIDKSLEMNSRLLKPFVDLTISQAICHNVGSNNASNVVSHGESSDSKLLETKFVLKNEINNGPNCITMASNNGSSTHTSNSFSIKCDKNLGPSFSPASILKQPSILPDGVDIDCNKPAHPNTHLNRNRSQKRDLVSVKYSLPSQDESSDAPSLVSTTSEPVHQTISPTYAALGLSCKSLLRANPPVMRTRSGSSVALAALALSAGYRKIQVKPARLVREVSMYLKERRIIRTIALVVSGFIICWAPFFVYYILEAAVMSGRGSTKGSLIISSEAKTLLVWLGYSNSVINPLIYAWANMDFRRCFRDIICCGWAKSASARSRSIKKLQRRRV